MWLSTWAGVTNTGTVSANSIVLTSPKQTAQKTAADFMRIKLVEQLRSLKGTLWTLNIKRVLRFGNSLVLLVGQHSSSKAEYTSKTSDVANSILKDTSRKSVRSTMTKSVERKRSFSRSASWVDVKCINWGRYISEEKVEEHSKNCKKGTILV